MLAAIDLVQLLPYALFGLFAGAGWLLYEFMSAGEARTEERLDELKNPHRRRNTVLQEEKKDSVSRVFSKASPALSKALQPKSEEDVGKLKQKLVSAGFRSETAPAFFLSLKVAGLIGGFVLGGGLNIALSGITVQTLQNTLLAAGILFYLPNIVLSFMTRRRKENIFLGLPDSLDLMVVCVEAGLGLDQAMRKVSQEMKKSYPVIADEFAISNFQLQMGRSRATVLHELGSRSDVDDLRSLASILVQADKFGSSVGQALRVQSEAMRTRRRQLAEERAAKTAVKLLFPLVLFIFPGIFVVLVGPAAVKFANEMAPAMAGENR